MKRTIVITEDQIKDLTDFLREEKERKVRHKENTAEDDRENWIDYWQEQTSLEIPGVCPSCGEKMQDPVGGHVTDDTTGELFITPVCRRCNSTYQNEKAYNHYFKVKEKLLLPL